MKHKTLPIIDRFSYSVFVVSLKRFSQKARIAEAILSVQSEYPDVLHEEQIHLLKLPGYSKKTLVLVKKNKDVFTGICSTMLSCLLLPSYTGLAIFVAENFYEHIEFEKGVPLKSNVKKKLEYAQIGAKEDATFIVLPHAVLPIGAGKKVYIPSDKVIIERYSESIVGISRRLFTKKSLILCIFALLFLSLVLFVGYGAYTEQQKIDMQQAQTELEAQKNEEELKRNTEKLSELQAEYIAIKKMESISAYDVLSTIYTLLDNAAKIHSLTLTGSNFQMEASTANAVSTLERFEKDKNIHRVEMRRIAVESNKEFFSLTGTIVNTIVLPTVNDTLKNQIAGYEQLLFQQNARNSIKHDSLSSGANELRKLLNKNNCREEVLQYVNVNEHVEIECIMRSSSENFLAFLLDARSSNIPFDFSIVRIRAVENSNTVTVTFRLKTGIEVKTDTENFVLAETDAVTEVHMITPTEIGNLFNTKIYVPVAVTQEVIEVVEEIKPSIEVGRHLQYLGSGKSEGTQYVLIKDKKNDIVHKLSSEDNKSKNSYSDNNETMLYATIDGITYEVKK